MHPGWRVVDFSDFNGQLRYSRGQLLVEPESSPKTVLPLSQIAVVLVGTKTTLSGALLQKFSEYDIAVLVCDWRRIPIAGALPWNNHSRIGARHKAQAELSVPKNKQAWARIIKAKIYGQAKVLHSTNYSPKSDELFELSRSVRSGDPDNKEGLAARKYWSAISGSISFHRLPGTGADTWNSALDYGYTLLRGYGMRACTSAGLSGALGLFHKERSNAFALVDDLMEPFRPMVDQIVFNSIEPNGDFDHPDKQLLSTGLDGAFSKDGRTLSTVFNDFAQHYGNYVEGRVKDLNVPRWEGSIDAIEGL